MLLLASLIYYGNNPKAQGRKNAHQHEETPPTADEGDD